MREKELKRKPKLSWCQLDRHWWHRKSSTISMVPLLNGSIFRVSGCLWGESTGLRWIPITKASNTDHLYFLSSAPEQRVEQTIDTPVTWDAIALIISVTKIAFWQLILFSVSPDPVLYVICRVMHWNMTALKPDFQANTKVEIWMKWQGISQSYANRVSVCKIYLTGSTLPFGKVHKLYREIYHIMTWCKLIDFYIFITQDNQ